MYQRPRIRVTTKTRPSPQPPPTRPEHSSLAKTQKSAAAQGDPIPAVNQELLEMEGVYIISVAARLLDMHPQTLRKYERLGLINPGRTIGMLRLYSLDDLRKVLLIRHLSDMGLNLAGVEFALGTVESLRKLKSRLSSVVGEGDLKATVENEVAQVFRALNLPMEQ